MPKNLFGHDRTGSNDNHRTNGFNWSFDPRIRSLPTHKVNSRKDEKSAIKDLTLGALAGPRRLIYRHWPFQREQMSWSHLTPEKTSLKAITPANSNVVFVLLCSLWYSTSAMSSNTGKAILMQFRYPVTLTFVQFGFVAFYCLIFTSPIVGLTKLRPPTRAILQNTLPMGMFQVGGHMFSSIAISRIPVSTVHAIKALSPLFTVAAYALLFGVSYSSRTYISLLPLTIGVIFTCSVDISISNMVGFICAFGSALVFVSSNIFFKKIMPSSSGSLTKASSHKLDKLNLLLYSSGMAFLLTIPLWIYHDLPLFLSSNSNRVIHPKEGHSTPHSVMYYFFMNGTVHFAQNIIAFVILSSTSPVTYSIASLIKRVAVICIAIVWFNQSVHMLQACGIILTFTGLYMYNNAKSDVEKGEKKLRRVEAARELMLPTTKLESQLMTEADTPLEPAVAEATGFGLASAYGRPRGASVAGASPFGYHSPHLHHHSHPPNNLSINTTTTPYLKELQDKDSWMSSLPLNSYPSPPPSVDSPPSITIPLRPESDIDEKVRNGQTHTATTVVF